MNKKDIPVLYERLEDCCGCSACIVSCPANAIAMKVDHEGFEYPYVDEDKCIRCYKCLNVCPVRTEKYNKEQPV